MPSKCMAKKMIKGVSRDFWGVEDRLVVKVRKTFQFHLKHCRLDLDIDPQVTTHSQQISIFKTGAIIRTS